MTDLICDLIRGAVVHAFDRDNYGYLVRETTKPSTENFTEASTWLVRFTSQDGCTKYVEMPTWQFEIAIPRPVLHQGRVTGKKDPGRQVRSSDIYGSDVGNASNGKMPRVAPRLHGKVSKVKLSWNIEPRIESICGPSVRDRDEHSSYRAAPFSNNMPAVGEIFDEPGRLAIRGRATPLSGIALMSMIGIPGKVERDPWEPKPSTFVKRKPVARPGRPKPAVVPYAGPKAVPVPGPTISEAQRAHGAAVTAWQEHVAIERSYLTTATVIRHELSNGETKCGAPIRPLPEAKLKFVPCKVCKRSAPKPAKVEITRLMVEEFSEEVETILSQLQRGLRTEGGAMRGLTNIAYHAGVTIALGDPHDYGIRLVASILTQYEGK